MELALDCQDLCPISRLICIFNNIREPTKNQSRTDSESTGEGKWRGTLGHYNEQTPNDFLDIASSHSQHAYGGKYSFQHSQTNGLTILFGQSHESPLDLVNAAYTRLTHDELVFFLKVRNLPSSGTHDELASRLTRHDFHTYHFPRTTTLLNGHGPTQPSMKQRRAGSMPDLPVEIMAYIMEQLDDWEFTTAVGIPSTNISQPLEWARSASSTDLAMITGYTQLIRSANPSSCPPTQLGAAAAVRFGYVNVLEYFLKEHRAIFGSLFRDDIIPIKASRHGRTTVLAWWKHGFEHHRDLIPSPKPGTISEAIDAASRGGQVDALDWWLDSGLPLEYTEAALEYASSKNKIPVLNWWKAHRGPTLPLKIGRVMDMASTAGHVKVLEWWAASQLEFKYDRHALHHASNHGRVNVLNWWLGSGLQLIFDQDALTGATRHNRPEVLEWWDKSGLPIQYRMCDIEEALEDAIGGGEEARRWWKSKGVDFNANDKEWMKLQNLNG